MTFLKVLRTIFLTVLPVAIIAAGVFAAYTLIKMKSPPGHQDIEVVHPLVKSLEIQPADIQMIVSGYGTVRPKVHVDIVGEVSGKAVKVHPQFKAGGFIKTGEALVKIDPRDYELAVKQADAAVADAQVRLDMEVAEAEVAKTEWGQLHPDSAPTSPLVLREPQIRQAQATLASAQAQLDMANLRLERTSICLPFDARILSDKVDIGQYVVAGQPVGSAYGVEVVEIEVPLEDAELAWFDVPMALGIDGEVQNTPAKVVATFSGGRHVWLGKVVRTVGQVDQASRLISVVIEVRQPFETSDSRPPLLPGVFAEVQIEGKILPDALAIPREAVRSGNDTWIIRQGELHVESLDFVRSDKSYAYALGDGKPITIVVSSLDAAVDGMMVRTQNGDDPNQDAADQSPPESAN